MFRKNQRHLQSALLSDLDHLTVKQRRRLDVSWAGYLPSRGLLPTG